MTNYLSNKIKVVSLICIVAVILWHSYMIPSNSGKFYKFFMFQNTITSSALRFSIPLFFIISGYLFFIKPFNYFSQIKKRFQSIVVPYFLWSIIGAAFIYALLLIPEFAHKTNLNWRFTYVDFLKHITISPIQYQFWFLQDLMILVIISPIIYSLRNNLLLPVIFILACSWSYFGDITVFIIRLDSLLFFSFGAFIALNRFKNNLLKIHYFKSLVIISFIVWLISSILYGYLITNGHLTNWILFRLLYAISIVCGIVFVWTIYDIVSDTRFIHFLVQKNITDMTFFIFCFHEPFLTFVEKITQPWASTNWQMGLLLFLNPAIVIFCSVTVYKVLKEVVPRMLEVLTGGRTDKIRKKYNKPVFNPK